MPNTFPSQPKPSSRGVDPTIELDYSYPKDLDLKPGSDLHRTILTEVINRAVTSHSIMSSRHSEWRRTDEVLRVYTKESFSASGTTTPFEGDYDTRRDGTSESPGDNAKIIMPMTYATLETLLTYMTAAFIQDPIFTYEGEGPEDTTGAYLLTRLIHRQVMKKQMALALHTQWRDAFSYGLGVVTATWCKEKGVYYNRDPYGYTVEDTTVITDYATQRRKGVIYEGNDLINIDPYCYLPDPAVPVHKVQEGTYVGWVDRTNYINLLDLEANDSKNVFNVEYLSGVEGSKLSSLAMGSTRDSIDSTAENAQYSRAVDVVHMYCNIIPKEWGLGDSKYPEKWYFAIAGDAVVISARPMNLDHNKYPVAVCAPDYDGYSANPVARLTLISDMQAVVDFLYTSRLQNIRKSINDMIVVDPSLVNINDLNNPQPGKLIRMRRAAWGGGKIDSAIKQLEVRDVTQGHIEETMFLQQVMQQVTGATDSMQGVLSPRTSRISSAEAQGVQRAALSRLEKAAKIISAQSMQPLGEMLAFNTQQMMSEEMYVQLTGQWEDKLRTDLGKEAKQNRVKVNPSDITIAFDVRTHDGTMPGSENIQGWVDLFTIIGQNQHLTQRFDMGRIFMHIARQMGAKNIDDFVIEVMPDEQVMAQAAAGQITPMV